MQSGALGKQEYTSSAPWPLHAFPDVYVRDLDNDTLDSWRAQHKCVALDDAAHRLGVPVGA
eukprot:2186934-Amphidinium_carterae.1